MSSKATDTQSEIQQTQPSRRGVLYVVSSPSGGGKGTLIRRVLDVVPNLSYSVSYTTRAPRNGEVNGREYFFVDRKLFEEMVAAGDFLEWAIVHGNLYGTSQKQVASETSSGTDIVLEVDVQGAASVRSLGLDSVSIFILPPSLETLRERLLARGTDTPESLTLRLRNAPKELSQYSTFDYVILNDDVDRATSQLAAIISAERARRSRQAGLVDDVVQKFKPN
ncbi:MAG TPA: guanylate kinase [Pyrinomonadaceae bacterium]|jgi:guanylate kinase|nr:guanylate kinase [Pyrinomonadaceae bacterium]